MSFYTKYRPQTIGELDLDSVKASLSTILASGKFSQAYLFCGPKGTGKTSSARILAKLLNCEKNREKLHEPCNQCDSCKRITSGQSLACLEMDAASNRGIDDIRQLRERIGLAPAEGKFTVYIIDEVHMLTTEAFNALLKTLEEPPAHAIFVLCTTDPQKIPDTVLSRCMRVNFTKATPKEILHSLQKAVTGESLQIEPQAINALADRVDGSFRDGMKVLEQLSLGGTSITSEMVDELTGYSAGYQVDKLIRALIKKDISTVLAELQQKQTMGIDAYILGKRLIESIRVDLVAALQQKQPSASSLLKLAALADEAVRNIRTSSFPFLPLEILAGEWCLNTSDARVSNNFQVPISNKIENIKPIEPEASRPVVASPRRQDMYSGSLDDITKLWPSILTAVRPYNHSLEALLKSTKLVVFKDGSLTIEAFYKFHKEQLEQDRYRRILEDVVSKILGGRVFFQFTIRQLVKADTAVDNVSGSVEDDALVKAAEEIFG